MQAAPSQLQQDISLWRKAFSAAIAEIHQSFDEKPNAKRLIKQQTLATDQLLIKVWASFGLSDIACLVAVGGYGRGELFPYSDVDILILIENTTDERRQQSIEAFIGALWDVGLSIGHSVRTLEECTTESAEDITVQTSMLEARLLTGKHKLYTLFSSQIHSQVNPLEFFHAKQAEQNRRHSRFSDSSHNLEPNLKESPGGLRDLQVILWVARAAGLGSDWAKLLNNSLISKDEYRQILHHMGVLNALRIRLHLLAKRREDKLVFDFQNELATSYGLKTNTKQRASEQLMARFYRSAKFINLMNEILLQSIEERIAPKVAEIQRIDKHFVSKNNFLDISPGTSLKRSPILMFNLFLQWERNPEIAGISAHLLRALHQASASIDVKFRKSEKSRRTFIKLLKDTQHAPEILTILNRYGILGRYIPAFGKIVGQMQHDLFHVYTVDEHILNVFNNINRFFKVEYNHEFPLCSTLAQGFKKPYLLLLGALFHDIAKGRGGDHSDLGKHDAKRFCKLHELPNEDSELVAWLVEAHLKMSGVAQKSDLSDPDVIHRFAEFVGTERRLIALYLLTVADIRGTSPKVWNAWKARLLESLFHQTRQTLQGKVQDSVSTAGARKRLAGDILRHYGLSDDSYKTLWKNFGVDYFSRHQSKEIAWHTRLLIAHLDTKKAIVRTRLSPEGDGIQVMVYTPNRDNVFGHICGFFERLGYNILEAKIYTTNHQYALDTFLIADTSDKSISYRSLLSYIEKTLSDILSQDQAPEPPLKGRLSRQVKHMPITPTIRLSPSTKENFYTLDIITGDRPGLLSSLAQVFKTHHIDLYDAKINTLGNRAEDSFLVSPSARQTLDADVLVNLVDDLKQAL